MSRYDIRDLAAMRCRLAQLSSETGASDCRRLDDFLRGLPAGKSPPEIEVPDDVHAIMQRWEITSSQIRQRWGTVSKP